MRYEHLLEVNDANGLVPAISRAQLWTGLMMRVLHPERFPVGPERCDLEPGVRPASLARRVHFGAREVRDTVSWEEGRQLVFRPEAADDLVPFVLTLTIEQHPPEDPDALYLRFVYEAEVDDADTDPVRQQAWLANDRDMMRTIRRWAQAGALGDAQPAARPS